MTLIYFTFGSDPAYPYGREDYVVAIGTDKKDCLETYRATHPNRPGSDAFNCADFYTAGEWEKIKNSYYKDAEPKEILVSDTAYGTKEKTYDPIWFFVPDQSDIIYVEAGSGNDLLPDDIEMGYKDYMIYTVLHMENGNIDEELCHVLMITRPLNEQYKCMADAITDVLLDAYNDISLDAQILRTSRTIF